MSIKIHCLGACREVGRSAFLVDGPKKLMFDYGLKVESGDSPRPVKERVDGLFLSHGHLDHLGMAPALHRKSPCRVFCTAPTFDQGDLLLRDSLKVHKLKGQPAPYTSTDVLELRRSDVRVQYGDEVKLGPAKVEVWDAGHIPGSCIYVAKMDGKKILYTGDFNLESTKLVHGARFDEKNVDVVIMENTYSSRDHPDREETYKKLFGAVRDTVNAGGIALLPSYAIRAAEILLVLEHFGAKFPVYLDGMAKAATAIALEHSEYVRDHKALKRACELAIPLYDNEERNNALKEPCAIITTGGCLEGGPVVHYIKNLYAKPESSILLTGFQIPRTAGRYLIDTGRFVVGTIDLKVKMNIQTFDMSAHAGRSELLKFVQKVRPEKVLCVHGEYCEKFATELKGRFGVEAIAPKLGEVIRV